MLAIRKSLWGLQILSSLMLLLPLLPPPLLLRGLVQGIQTAAFCCSLISSHLHVSAARIHIISHPLSMDWLPLREGEPHYVILFCGEEHKLHLSLVIWRICSEDSLFWGVGGKENMTSPAKFKKDKEIIAEYDTQVKGEVFFQKASMFIYCALYVQCSPFLSVFQLQLANAGTHATCLGVEGKSIYRSSGICSALQ